MLSMQCRKNIRAEMDNKKRMSIVSYIYVPITCDENESESK